MCCAYVCRKILQNARLANDWTFFCLLWIQTRGSMSKQYTIGSHFFQFSTKIELFGKRNWYMHKTGRPLSLFSSLICNSVRSIWLWPGNMSYAMFWHTTIPAYFLNQHRSHYEYVLAMWFQANAGIQMYHIKNAKVN